MNEDRIELQTRKNEIERKISFLEAQIGNCQIQQQATKIKAEKLHYMDEESEYNGEIRNLKEELAHIECALDKLKRFNREVCLENIDFLLAQKDVKLGVLESDSGNRPGYLSRMKSGKSTSDPSIEFLMTASEKLEVPLDMLVSSRLSEMSATEKFILDFLKKAASDTQTDKLEWIRETVTELEKLEVEHDNNGYPEVSHPLYVPFAERTEDTYYEYPLYNSLFFKNCGVKPCNNGYHAKLVPTDQWLYIMECEKGDERICWKNDRFFELYLVNFDRYGNATTKKVCNTLEVSSPVCVTINSLIKSIITSMSRVHIEDDVRDAIDSYMNGIVSASDDDILPFN
ncbi:MAG: hypothetical protein J6C99_05100 [Lachnospiraceae bacterium]|nr:hypothetical protein [Lachnospiraceae bacterium]